MHYPAVDMFPMGSAVSYHFSWNAEGVCHREVFIAPDSNEVVEVARIEVTNDAELCRLVVPRNPSPLDLITSACRKVHRIAPLIRPPQ